MVHLLHKNTTIDLHVSHAWFLLAREFDVLGPYTEQESVSPVLPGPT